MFTLMTAISGWAQPLVEQANAHLTRPFNNLAGRSWLFDSLVSLPLENDLVKAALVGACFYAAWHERETLAEALSARKMLLVTLCAAALTITTTKMLSHMVLLPRPLVQTQEVYYLEADRLVAAEPLASRAPLDAASRKAQQNLLRGDVDVNDLGSFPSDHAGLFFALSFGVWLASRRWGRWALGWTVLVVVQAKLISGQHTVLDALAGVGVGAAVVLACRRAARLAWPDKLLTRALHWADAHRALSSALLFVAVFEVSNTLTHVRHLLKFGAAAARHLLKG